MDMHSAAPHDSVCPRYGTAWSAFSVLTDTIVAPLGEPPTFPGWDPTEPPPGFPPWRGPDPPGGPRGGYNGPGGSMSPDLSYGPPVGPHWDWVDPAGAPWRIYPPLPPGRVPQ
jgi:hypothetical protein